jgi:Domain of unknown function (DUF4386)
MNNYRKTAIIVGVLYIIGTVAGILSVASSGAIREAPYLGAIAANPNQIVVAALFVLLMGLALALVPVMLFPLLKKHNEVLALGYVVFRGALETALYIGMTVGWLVLIALGLEYVKAGAPAESYFQTLGTLVLAGNEAMSTILIIVFSLNALMLYTVFYQSKLIPRWLSIWGFIAILLHLTTAFLLLFSVVESTSSPVLMVFNLLILVQEMVMAVWLIMKGFNSAAIAAQTTLNSGDQK